MRAVQLRVLALLAGALLAVGETRADDHRQEDLPLPKPPTPEHVIPFDDNWFHVKVRILEQIETLNRESLKESLANLSDARMYYWPFHPKEGGALVLPMPPSAGKEYVHAIMSNRRFLKVFQELSSLPESQAASLLSTQIESSLHEYRILYEQYMQKRAAKFDPDYTGRGGLGGRLWMADGSPTLKGFRLQLLALAFLAGNLELQEARPALMAVAQEARNHRLSLTNEGVRKNTGISMLRQASLYHRQILGGALLATAEERAGAEELRRQLGLEWRTKRLTLYNAAVTPYDHHAGGVPVDYSKGELRVQFFDAMDDSQFDKIVEWVLLSGQPR